MKFATLKNRSQLKTFLIVVFMVSSLLFPSFVFAEAGMSEAGINNGVPRNSTSLSSINKFFYDTAIGFGGLVVWGGGQLLDFSIDNLVIGMGSEFNNGETPTDLGNAVTEIWMIFRDFFNILFIFGLVYIGFRTILNSEDSTARKALATLVAAALLINFSLYVTKVIIDFSNITATEIYEVNAKGDVPFGVVGLTLNDTGISAAFLKVINFQSTITDGGVLEELAEGDTFSWKVLGFSFLMMLFMLILGFVFAAGGILLIARFAALIIFMMLSPIMFLGWVFPGFKSYSSMWWKRFLNYAFFAPAYLFMLFVAFKATEALVGRRQNELNFSDIYSNEGSATFGVVVIYFAVMVALLIAALKVAEQMSEAGSKTLTNGVKYVRGVAQGYAGRNTVGKIGDWYDKRLENKGVPSTSSRRRLASNAASAKFESSYSRRDIKEADKKAAGSKARYEQVTGISSSINTGMKATASSTEKIEMERQISNASTEQLLALLQKEEVGSKRFNTIVEHMKPAQYDAFMKAKEEDLNDKAKSAVASARTSATKSKIQSDAQKADPTLSNSDALKAGISKASPAELKVMGAETIQENASKLTEKQMDDIKKSPDFTATEITNIVTAREDQLVAEYTGPTPNAVFSKRKDEDIAKLPKQILLDKGAVTHLTKGSLFKMLDTLVKADRDVIRQNIDDAGLIELHDHLKTPRLSEF